MQNDQITNFDTQSDIYSGSSKEMNNETRQAIQEVEAGKGQTYKCMDDVWNDITDV